MYFSTNVFHSLIFQKLLKLAMRKINPKIMSRQDEQMNHIKQCAFRMFLAVEGWCLAELLISMNSSQITFQTVVHNVSQTSFQRNSKQGSIYTAYNVYQQSSLTLLHVYAHIHQPLCVTRVSGIFANGNFPAGLLHLNK